MTRSLWMSALFALYPLLAGAQATKGADQSKPPEGIGTAEDPLAGQEEVEEDDTATTYDDPNDPDAVTTRDSSRRGKQAVRYTKGTYPIEAIDRPLTLAASQFEISLDVPVEAIGADGGPFMTQVLRAGYGVTTDLQIGVAYGIGLELLNPPEGAKAFEAGKAFSLDAAHTILPGNLAAQLSLPFYADPFAWSVSLGVPFRVKITDKIAFVGGQDLVAITLVRFPVDPAQPWMNVAHVALDAVGAARNDGHVNLNFGAQIQAKRNLAFTAKLGLYFPDFDDNNDRVYTLLGAAWSKNPKLDIGGRLGVGDLGRMGDTFGLAVFVAYRL